MNSDPVMLQRVVSYPLRGIGYLVAFPFVALHYIIKWIFWPYAYQIKVIEDSRDRWKKVADNRYTDLEIQKREFERLRSSKHRLEVKYQRLLIIKRQMDKELKK